MLTHSIYKPAFFAACIALSMIITTPSFSAEPAAKPKSEAVKSSGKKDIRTQVEGKATDKVEVPPAETLTMMPAEADLPDLEPNEVDEDPTADEARRLSLIPRTEMIEEGAKTPPFTDVLTVRQTLRKYPFLKQSMPGMRASDQIRLGRQKVGNTTLLYFFLNLRDEQGVCGALGCPMTVWADEGYGYHKAMDILKKYYTGVQTRLNSGKLSLLFCDPDRGQSTWDFENGKFMHKGVDPEGPDCMGTDDDTLEPAPLMMRGADEPEVDESESTAQEEKAIAEDAAEKENTKGSAPEAPAVPAKAP